MKNHFAGTVQKLKQIRNEAGNVSMLFAIAAVPMLLAVGVAIDYLRASNAQTELQNAVDGAALAIAGSGVTGDSQLKKIGINYFKSNFKDSLLEGATPDITISKDSIIVSVDFNYPTTLMSLAGYGTMKIGSLAEVGRGNDNNAEVVMVLDYSLSMVTNNKYIRMRQAATKMIDQIAGSGANKVKFGIVPFSAMVRTSMPKAYVTQATVGATWTGCTQDRKYPYNVGVSIPTADDDTKWGFIDDNGSENAAPKKDCAMYQNNGLDIMPLSADAAAVKARLAAMEPVGNTNIPLGAEFGWNLLDPDAPFTEGAPYGDGKTKKFLVLLTDGVQTSRHFGDKGNRSVANGNENLKTTCKNATAKGITIFAIAYDIKATAVTDLLKVCAPDNYFEASTGGSEIDEVFKLITKRIKKGTMRLAR